jgi:hypothetical protein
MIEKYASEEDDEEDLAFLFFDTGQGGFGHINLFFIH